MVFPKGLLVVSPKVKSPYSRAVSGTSCKQNTMDPDKAVHISPGFVLICRGTGSAIPGFTGNKSPISCSQSIFFAR